jgi:myosin-5
LQDVGDEEFRLLAALSQPLGFHRGKPLAAMIIFRCCLEWGALEARRTRIFQHIIQVGVLKCVIDGV